MRCAHGLRLVSVVVVCASVGGRAEAAPSADELIRDGLELRRAGRDDQALPKFEQAYRLTPTPRAAGQLGFCQQALGRFADADERVSEALAAKDDPWVVKNRAALLQALGTIKAHVGRLAVVGDPAGAEVLVGGRSQGRLPLPGPIRVDAGAIDLEVRAPGAETLFRTVEIAGGAYQTVSVHLVPRGRAATDEGGLAAQAPGAAPQALVATPGSGGADEAAAARPLYKSPWLWAVVGGALVAGAVAAFVVVRSGTDYPSSTRQEPFP
jgi:hypothetical protein